MRKWDVMVQANEISVSAQFDFWATGILDEDPMPPILIGDRLALVFSDNGRAGGSVLDVEPDDRIVIQTGVIKWRLRRARPEDDIFMLTTDLAREAWIVVEQVAANTATRSS